MRIICIGFCFLALLAGCSQERPEVLERRAEEAYAAGHYAKAIAAYERLLMLSGESAITYGNLALAALAAQDTAAARAAAEKGLALAKEGPQAERCQELLGMISEEVKEPEAAVPQYRALLAQAKDPAVRVRVASRLARIYADQGRADGALALLLMASNEAPQDAGTLYNLGKLCVREPLLLRQAALDAFRMADRLLPAGSVPARETKNWITRLEQNLERLQQVPPAAGNARACAEALKAAREAKAKKRWPAAQSAAAKAVKADPSNYEAALEWARMCVQNANRDQALKAYDAALALRSGSVEARQEAAQLAYDLKRYDVACTYLRPALVVQRKNRYLADLMMRILAAQKRLPEARLWGEYYLALDTSAPAAYRKWVQSLPEK